MGNSQQSARLCEMLLDQGPACHWALDRDLTIRGIFGNSAPLFSRASTELSGTRLTDALPSGQVPAWRDRVKRVFCGEAALFRETRASRLFSISLYPIRDEAGAVTCAGGCAVDITPLSAAERELRTVALDVIRAQEAERARLARILHDEVGQGLSAAGLQLDLLRMDLEKEVPSISSRTGEVQQLLEKLMQRVREFSYELNPATVERTGLYPALDRLVGRLRHHFPGTLRLVADSSLRVPSAAASALYKIAQEALENSIRHSECTVLEVQLKSTRQGTALEVRDNGKGFDATDAAGLRPGLGLLIMEHCATDAGLGLSINSNRAQGTVVRAICNAAARGGGD